MAARLWLWPHYVTERLHQGKQYAVLGVTDRSSERPVLPHSLGAIGEALAQGTKDLGTLCDSFSGCYSHFHLFRQRTLIRVRRVQPLTLNSCPSHTWKASVLECARRQIWVILNRKNAEHCKKKAV